ncbi:hypothetical protein [Paenisporosarcina sp. TG20]|uniref:hypothetical protein n=1 Tax=Paenisporosarcina sp. TG20 TaxID=1211706 RepID=UPI0002FDE95D|nr:hypothetical protein [Paenisporosarcina sp. TG20]
MEILAETVLGERFIVWSQFFEETFVGDRVLIRPEASIKRREGTSTFNTEKHPRADAVIVMFNPGSCKPTLDVHSGEWTESMPDKTQFQLMRLMEHMAWNEMKIVNLSDLCEGNFTEFVGLLKRCDYKGIAHSRFVSNPESEWSKVISGADRLLYGWGEKSEAKELANVYGLSDADNMVALHGKKPIAVWDPVRGYPKHPFPFIPKNREAWLEEMVELLNDQAYLKSERLPIKTI